MSDKIEIQASKNIDEWINWIERANYEYKDFRIIDKIGDGAFGEVYCANWKNSEKFLALKLFKHDNATVKEIVHEVTTKYDIYLSQSIQC